MPGINQLGGALGITGTTPSNDVAGGANQEAQSGLEPVPNDAVKAVREFEPAPKESQDDSSVDARREARRFADLQRSKGRPDPDTGDVINISAEGRARATGDAPPPEPPPEEVSPPPEDPDRPSSVRGEPVRRFDDLFAKGYGRGDDQDVEQIEAEPPPPERAPEARAETTQVAPEEPAPERRQAEASNDLPDESVSAVSEAS